MKNFTKILLAAGALTVSALTHALPVVSWNVQVTGAWDPLSVVPGTVGISNAGKTLSWGLTTSPQSSLTITNPSPAGTVIDTFVGPTGSVPNTAQYVAPSVSLTHVNNPISPGSSLTAATLDVALTLRATNPNDPTPVLNADVFSYAIKFVETTNSGTCSIPTSTTPCNDIFVQLGGFLNDSFTYENVTYFVNAFPTNGSVLSTLPATACIEAGLTAGCIGFSTAERETTVLPFGLAISTSPLAVPEPGSLALIGLALAGLGFVSRRRSSAA